MGTTKNDTILRAIKGEVVSHTPVWFMRQKVTFTTRISQIKRKILTIRHYTSTRIMCLCHCITG